MLKFSNKILYKLLKSPQTPSPMNKEAPKSLTLVVMIPAYNEEKLLSTCLNSLVNQKTSLKFEVILVNNNSSDNTQEVAESFKRKLNLKIFFEKQKGRGAARKIGFEKAKGEIILSTDADSVVPSSWIEEHISAFKINSIVATTGPCKIIDCSPATNKTFNFLQPKLMAFYRAIFGHYWLSGFNFAIKKSIYEKSGGFNSQLNALEDLDLAFRVKKLGKISFFKKSTVTFSGRRFNKGLLTGFLLYVLVFTKYLIFKKHTVKLSDIR